MPAGQPTVFLHVGIAKTGTTYLQALLWHNRQRLEQHGLRYPGDRLGDHFRASLDLRQATFMGEDSTLVPGAWEAVARAAARAPHRAVISHETLARTGPKQARAAVASLRPAQVHVVLTVRDLARQLPAVWQERVKNTSSGGYEHFLGDVAERPRTRVHRRFWEGQDPLGILERWSAAVPPERMHVVTLPRRGAPPGVLWERFASVLGVPADLVETDVPVSNLSLGVAEAEMLRRLNPALRERLDWPTYSRKVKMGLAGRLAAAGGSARLEVPLARREWVLQRAEETIAGLSAGGYDVVGDLDELRPLFGDRPVVMPADIPDAQLWRLAGEVVGDLLMPGAPPLESARARAARRAKRAVLVASRFAAPTAWRVREAATGWTRRRNHKGS